MISCAVGANTDFGMIFICSTETPMELFEYPTPVLTSFERDQFIYSTFPDTIQFHTFVSDQTFIFLSTYPDLSGFKSFRERL